MTICDRIMAICAGQVSQSYKVADVSLQDVGLLMGGQAALEQNTASVAGCE